MRETGLQQQIYNYIGKSLGGILLEARVACGCVTEHECGCYKMEMLDLRPVEGSWQGQWRSSPCSKIAGLSGHLECDL